MNEKFVYAGSDEFDNNHDHTLVMTCSDPRFFAHTLDFLNNHLNLHKFDSLIMPGGPAAVCLSSSCFFVIRPQIKLLHGLHNFKTIIGFAHEDCGYYGLKYPQLKSNQKATREKQTTDLVEFLGEMKKYAPDARVECYYMRLGEANKVNQRVEFVLIE